MTDALRRGRRALADLDVLRNVGRLASAEVFALVLLTVVSLLIARHLGPREFGRFAVLTSLAALVVGVLDLRAADALTRFLRPLVATPTEPARAYGVVFTAILVDAAVLLLTCASLLLASLVVPARIGGTPIEAVLAALVLAVPVLVASSRAVLMALDAYTSAARLQAVLAVVRLVAVGVAVSLDAALLGILVAVLLSQVVEVAVLVVAAGRAFRGVFAWQSGSASARDVATSWREIRIFVAWNGLQTVSGSVVKNADTIVLGLVSSTQSAAYYRLGKSFSVPVLAFATPLQSVLYNQLSSLVVRAPRQAVAGALRRASLVGAVMAVGVLVLVPFMPTVVRVAAGEPFAPAALPAQLLLVGSALGLLGYAIRPAVLALGQLRRAFVVSVVTAAVAVPAFVLAAAQGGADGVALARLLTVSAFGLLAGTWIVRAGLRRHDREAAEPSV